MRLSVLELGHPAICVELAPRLDAWGYSRYWIGEHHAPGHTTNPLLLAGMIAGTTKRIKVGSAAILLPYHAPRLVAEDAFLLNFLYPNRIDLGICSGMPIEQTVKIEILDGRPLDHTKEFHAKADALMKLLRDRTCDVGHGGGAAKPMLWVMGLSVATAELAGRLGAAFCFSEHHNRLHRVNADAAAVLARYRQSFVSQADSVPTTSVAISGVCGETDSDTSAMMTRHFERNPRAASTLNLVGGVDQFVGMLRSMQRILQNDEFAIMSMIPDVSERSRMYELISSVAGCATDSP